MKWIEEKSTMIPLLDAEWGAYHAASGVRPHQALHRRVEMKKWPFDGLKIDRCGEKWPEFRWYHRWNRLDETYRSNVVTWQSTNYQFWRKKWRQPRYARQYCHNDDDLQLTAMTMIYNCLITRQGASFDVDGVLLTASLRSARRWSLIITQSRQASTETTCQTSSRPEKGHTNDL